MEPAKLCALWRSDRAPVANVLKQRNYRDTVQLLIDWECPAYIGRYTSPLIKMNDSGELTKHKYERALHRFKKKEMSRTSNYF